MLFIILIGAIVLGFIHDRYEKRASLALMALITFAMVFRYLGF